VVTFDQTVQENGQPRRLIRLEVIETTGAAGTIEFSKPIGSISATRIACTPSGCTLAETTEDAFVIFKTELGPLTIVLRDAGGSIVQTLDLP
jgi:hypothetical protein